MSIPTNPFGGVPSAMGPTRPYSPLDSSARVADRLDHGRGIGRELGRELPSVIRPR